MTKMTASKLEHLRRAIAAAIGDQAFGETEGGVALSALSHNTQFEAVEVFDDEISISGQTFTGPIVWHVDLIYRDNEGDILQSESFPGMVAGRINGEQILIDHMTADTRAFYE